jgi:hypothetical protein
MLLKKEKEYSSKSDYDRCFEDLVYDVKQKRKLNYLLLKLNKRLRMAINLSSVAIVFLIGMSIYSDSIHYEEKNTFDYYYSNFKQRYLSNYNSERAITIDIINKTSFDIDSSFISILNIIEDKNFTEAISMLSKNDSDESEWLRALCLLRINEKPSAKILLKTIVAENTLFSLDAMDILDNHYSCEKD